MPIHSAIFIAFGGLLLTSLAGLTTRLRIRHRIFVGHGDRPDLQRFSRAHGVSVEHLLPLLLLLLALELCGANHWVVDAFGVAIIGSRLLHVAGFVRGDSQMRVAGMTGTYAVEVALALWLLAQALRGF